MLVKNYIKSVLLGALLITLPGILFGQQKIIFRYNADYNLFSSLQSPVELKNVDVSPRVDDAEEIARGADGWGYSTRNTAYFHGDSAYIRTTGNVGLNFFGTVAITGEVWAKSFDGNGVLQEWDDPVKPYCFRLALNDGRLLLQNTIAGQLYQLESSRTLDVLKWYGITWVCDITADSVIQTVMVNGQPFAENRSALISPTGYVVLNAPVSLGFSFNDTLSLAGFNGEIYAATLRNYRPREDYLHSAITFDGGPYLGMAAFHDYPTAGTELPIDQRITVNPTPVLERAFVPYVNDDFIPQGLTNSYEDEDFSGPDGMVYVAFYNMTIDGVTRQKHSIVVEMDPANNYRVRRVFRLMGELGYSHSGGIAFKHNSIYVSSGSSIEVYPLPAYEGGGSEKYQDLASGPDHYFLVNSQASFCSVFGDTIWVGDYRTSSQSNPYLYGYPLDDQGNVINNVAPKIYRLPYQTQGATWKMYDGRRYLFLSVSGGSAGSKIYRCRMEDLSKTAPPPFDQTFNVPQGGEDISFNADGNLLNVSESSALYYQKRDNPWPGYYPFVYLVAESTLFADVPVSLNGFSGDHPAVTPDNYSLSTYPNPFNSELTVSFSVRTLCEVDARIYDVNGREISVLTRRAYAPGDYRMHWNAAGCASGVYLLRFNAGDNPGITRKIVLVK